MTYTLFAYGYDNENLLLIIKYVFGNFAANSSIP